MISFVKVYQTILDSSVWSESPATRLVWLTMLVMADEDGDVHASVGGLAHRSRVTREEADEALSVLLSPDPDDRSGVNDGIRLVKIQGGWHIVNHRRYRDFRTKQQIATAERVRRHRSVTVTDCNAGNAPLTLVTTDTEAEADTEEDQIKKGTRPAGTAARKRLPLAKPVSMSEDWEPDPKLVAALATEFEVTEARIRRCIPNVRWYWTTGKGAGKRRSPRGWDTTFRNRVAALAKSEELYAERDRGGNADPAERKAIEWRD